MWPLVADIMSNSVDRICNTCANTTPYTHKHFFHIVESYSILALHKLNRVCLSWETPEASWFYFGNNLCRHQDFHNLVWPCVADMMSKSVGMTCNTCANTTLYAHKHVFHIVESYSTSALDKLNWVCQSWEIPLASLFFLATTCADTKICITLYGLGWQTWCQNVSKWCVNMC